MKWRQYLPENADGLLLVHTDLLRGYDVVLILLGDNTGKLDEEVCMALKEIERQGEERGVRFERSEHPYVVQALTEVFGDYDAETGRVGSPDSSGITIVTGVDEKGPYMSVIPDEAIAGYVFEILGDVSVPETIYSI